MVPGILLEIVTSSDDSSRARNCTWFLSARTFFHKFIWASSREGMGGIGPPAPFAPGPGFMMPNGVSRPSDWSTYQNHCPFSSFQVLGIGAKAGSVNPGMGRYVLQCTTTLAFVKLSE